MSRRISGFTLEMRGSHEEMQRLLDVVWKEIEAIDRETRARDDLFYGTRHQWPLIVSTHTVIGTVTVQEEVAAG